MYPIGALIIYGGDGVCRVDHVGPLEMQGVPKNVDYYTLAPLHRAGKIFAPVDTTVFTRPIMTQEEANTFIDQIPSIPAEVYENSNPRILSEHYQSYLKSCDCMKLVRLVRSIYIKGRNAAEKGRHLGQVDERSLKRAQEMLHGELAAALDIPLNEVENYITARLAGREDVSFQ